MKNVISLLALSVLSFASIAADVEQEKKSYIYGGIGTLTVATNAPIFGFGVGKELTDSSSIELETNHRFNSNGYSNHHLWNVNLAGKFDAQLTETFALYGKVGLAYNRWDMESYGGSAWVGEIQPTFAVGADIATSDSGALRIQYNVPMTDMPASMDSVMLMGSIKF